MKNLNEMGVQEMNCCELKKTEGGIWLALAMFIGACINDAQNNPDDFKSGWDSAASHYH